MATQGTRPYRSGLRAEQARATRRAVVRAAEELFVERGYAGTTIDAVAERAGVSRKTVFTSVGGKAELLKLAWDWALAGDDEPLDVASRPVVQSMMAERDPVRLVGTWAAFVSEISARVADLHPVLSGTARSDPEIAAIDETSERNLLGGATAFVARLAAIGALREDLTVGTAAPQATLLMDPMPYRRLVRRAGWSFEDYVAWVAATASAMLLRPASPE
ncbi:MAG: helix-turn-helix domain-containing protein [Nocardioidaceae bacterium]